MSDRPDQDWHLDAPLPPNFAAHAPQVSKWYPQLVSYAPSSGPGGTVVTVDIRALEWPADHSNFVYSFLFGSVASWATNTSAQTGSDNYYYLSLQAPVPVDYHQTGDVQVTLRIQDSKGNSIASLPCGIFGYSVAAYSPAYHVPTAIQSGTYPDGHARHEATRDATAASAMHPPPQPNYIATSVPPSMGQLEAMNSAWATTSRANLDAAHTSTAELHSYGSTPIHSPTSTLPTNTLPTNALPANTLPTGYSSIHRRPGPMRHRTSPQTPVRDDAAHSPYTRNPVLIRTSMLQSPSADDAARYTPYMMYPSNKAILRIEGDLDSMARGWTAEEKEIGRRLVQFSRDQQGNVIHLRHRPVTREERSPHSMCVSCIWWEEKKEAYVTSVDTIALLEKIVATRFTVEEKNRIRRNLEGFHPMTVSKAKCESFFTAIMRFPPPKPRNIEKDVKVFPWKVLASALKKIVSKYSASYTPSHSGQHQPTLLRAASDSPSHEPSPASSSASAPLLGSDPHRLHTQSALGVLPAADIWASSYTGVTSPNYEYTWRPAMPLSSVPTPAALYNDPWGAALDVGRAPAPSDDYASGASYAPYEPGVALATHDFVPQPDAPLHSQAQLQGAPRRPLRD